ncbi:MAG: C45 family autoproteolytic acyltransferase/hydrolase [Acidimicrobiia bacterium]
MTGMHGGAMRVLEVFGDSADLGRGHGSACTEMIGRYLEDRIGLTSQEAWSGSNVDRDFIVETAEDTLEHHERYSESLYAEMVSLGEAAGITPAEAVVVGGFTDLVDVVRGRVGVAPAENNCTAVINPELGFLAQTWDMHASAGEFVFMLKLDPLIGPDAFVQTTAGCLGQMGLNESGIAVGINNLTAVGKPGVTWPFVVRKVLEQTDFGDAVQAVLDADVAGGHNFLVMGPDGDGASIEAMPRGKKVTNTNGSPLVHTNHCVHPETAAEEGERLPEHVESSNNRLEIGSRNASDLEAFFSDPAISRHASEPHLVATCGAVIMEPAKREMRAVWGVPGDHPWETFHL